MTRNHKTDPKEFEKFIRCLPQDVVDAIEDPQEDVRLIPIQRYGKAPDVEKGGKAKECNLTVEEARKRLVNEKNVGLYMGKLLVAIDVDQPDKLSDIFSDPKELLESTLCSETRSGGYHLILRNENIRRGTTYGDEEGEIAGLRVGWEQVLVPGSYVFEPEDGISGRYAVHTEKEPILVSEEDLPKELTPSAQVDLESLDIDVDDPDSIDPSKITGYNEKTVGELRREDEKLNALCKSIEPPELDKPSPSEYDMSFATKLLWYEFEPEDVAKLFLVYRDRDKIRDRFEDYLLNRTIPKAREMVDETISDSLIQDFTWNEQGLTVEIASTKGSFTLRVYKDKNKWKHRAEHYVTTGKDILGLTSSDRTRRRKKQWLKKVAEDFLGVGEDKFKSDVWRPLKGKIYDEGVLLGMDDVPPIQALEIRDMLEKLTIFTSIDKYDSYPAELTVEWNGVKKTLRMTTASVEKIQKVREEFIKSFGMVPDLVYDIGEKTWGKHVVSKLQKEGKVEFSEQEENTEWMVARKVLEEVRTAELTTERQEALSRPNFLEYKDGLVWLPSREVQEVLDNSRLGVNLRRFAGVMRTMGVLREIKDLKTSHDTAQKFWGFDPEASGVSKDTIKEVENGVEE